MSDFAGAALEGRMVDTGTRKMDLKIKSQSSVRHLSMAVVFLFSLAFSLALPAWAQVESWELLNQKVLALNRQGDYTQAVTIAQQALKLAETGDDTNQPNPSNVGANLINLAELYRAQGIFSQAEASYLRALMFWEQRLGPDHAFISTILYPLAGLYQNQKLYEQAMPHIKRALAIQEKELAPDHPAIITSLQGMANLYGNLHQYVQAIALLKRALLIQERTLGFDHPMMVQTLQTLAVIYINQGQFALAEPLYTKSLAIQENTFGLEHINVAVSLYQLAKLFADQRQDALAEPFYKRSLAISDKSLGLENPISTANRYGLVKIYINRGQRQKAESLYGRVLAGINQSQPLVDPAMAPFHLNLQPSEMTPDQLSQAEKSYDSLLKSEEKHDGTDSPALLGELIKLAEIYRVQGNYLQAETLFKQALAIEEKLDMPEHPGLVLVFNKLADLYRAHEKSDLALTMARRATSIYRHRLQVIDGAGDKAIRETSNNQSGFFIHLDLLSQNPNSETADSIANEAFQVVQLVHASSTASAITQMSVRFAQSNDALATLIRRKQDTAMRLVNEQAQLVTAASKPPHQRNPVNEHKLRQDILSGELEISRADEELSRLFPQYQELTHPKPVQVRQVQALLKPGEAMVVYALGERNSFLWLIKPESVEFKLLKLTLLEVTEKIATVRAEMVPNRNGRQQRVSVDVLYDLYQGLFAAAEPALVGIRHLLVVPAGPLQSLPFGMLVATAPPPIQAANEYSTVDWLVKHFAISVLPAVSSLQALRQIDRADRAIESFVGFGDPVVGQGLATPKRARAKINNSSSFHHLASQVKSDALLASQADIADVESIREAPPLPETGTELRAMAKALKATGASLWLRENATETKVKSIDLSKYRTIAFATHGVMAGEINGVGEAGLILTPPQQGTVDDDGFLAASEIAKLKLNADWVLLSACNTAAADGTPGAEGFSGLAKAFFYAGAKSLLVSHWKVDSNATVPLTIGMLKEYEAHPQLGKAQAQRKAMLALMNTHQYAHPFFWAPFVIVGEGGVVK